MSKKITNPIHTLVGAIDKIGSGDLNTEIKISSNDEIGFLGKTMDHMRMNIIKRDAQMKLMLANVAHEIRNPLGGIELFAGILAEELGQEKNNLNDGASNKPAQTHLEKITHEVRKLNQIITEFLDFARPKQPQKTKTSLKELIQSTYFMLALEFDKAKVGFHSEVEPLLKINVDPEQFKRVFVNLFKNSLQAIQNSKMKDGKVTVRSKRKEGIVEIIVKDNGPGIPQKKLPCLFEPFFTTKEKGAGLGLAIVQKIVTDHGENIEIQSTEGKSTTAIIRLSQP
jgi:nitrogen fixation/metabolism regulation signal transduction histidine kinase